MWAAERTSLAAFFLFHDRYEVADDVPYPLWWTRQYLDSFVLSEEEAWRIIDGPPWKCVIGWVTRGCEPVVCEMAYAVVDGMIMLTSTRNRDKVKALRRNPAISICFQGAGLKQVTVRGRVEFREDPQMVRRWAEATVANALFEAFPQGATGEGNSTLSEPGSSGSDCARGEDADFRWGKDVPGGEGRGVNWPAPGGGHRALDLRRFWAENGGFV